MALTSSTSSGRSIGIVCSRTKATELVNPDQQRTRSRNFIPVLRVHTRPQSTRHTSTSANTHTECPKRNFGPAWLTDPRSQQRTSEIIIIIIIIIPAENVTLQYPVRTLTAARSVIATLWPWGQLSLQQKQVPGIFLAVESGRCVRLTSPSVGPLSGKCGSFDVSPHGPPVSVTWIALPFFLQALNKIVTTSRRECPHFDGPQSLD
jgi:hypothetical protein